MVRSTLQHDDALLHLREPGRALSRSGWLQAVARAVALSTALAPVHALADGGPAGTPAAEQRPPSGATPRWLSWTLFGLGAAGTATAVIAFSQREQHATRWNGAACIQPGVRRGNVCPDELAAIRAWDITLSVSAVAAVGFFTGAVLTRSLGPSAPESSQRALAACGIGWGQIACSGRF